MNINAIILQTNKKMLTGECRNWSVILVHHDKAAANQGDCSNQEMTILCLIASFHSQTSCLNSGY